MAAPHSLRIFAPCAYLWSNKGDATLVLSMMQAFRRRFGRVDFTLTSFDPQGDSLHYGAEAIEMPISPNGWLSKFSHGILVKTPLSRLGPYVTMSQVGLFIVGLRIWAPIGKRFPRASMIFLSRRVRRVVTAVRDADLVVGVPGGYLMAPAVKDDYWLYHVATLAVPIVLGKPVGLYSCSIGPFVGPHRRFARWLFGRIQAVALREPLSLDHVREIPGISARIIMAPDAAFAFECGEAEIPMEVATQLANAPRPWIGFSVRHYHFPGSKNPDEMLEKYISEITRCIHHVIDELGGTAIFVPQSLDAAGKDIDVAKEIGRRSGRDKGVILVHADLSPSQLQDLYAKFDVMVGTRMHANILALSRGIPTIAIAYEHKTIGIMETVGMERWSMKMTEVSGRLLPLLEQMVHERARVREELQRILPPLKDDARDVVELLTDSLNLGTGVAR